VVVVYALLAGCAAILETPPASGDYARLKIPRMDDARLAVAVVRMSKTGSPTLGYEPRDRDPHPMLWLYPGDYRADLYCNRPHVAADGTQTVTTGTEDETDHGYNFSFSVETNGSYQLDCTSSADGEKFVLTPLPRR
jgi:hypothetical protein